MYLVFVAGVLKVSDVRRGERRERTGCRTVDLALRAAVTAAVITAVSSRSKQHTRSASFIRVTGGGGPVKDIYSI